MCETFRTQLLISVLTLCLQLPGFALGFWAVGSSSQGVFAGFHVVKECPADDGS